MVRTAKPKVLNQKSILLVQSKASVISSPAIEKKKKLFVENWNHKASSSQALFEKPSHWQVARDVQTQPFFLRQLGP